jgi:hypothetical protein
MQRGNNQSQSAESSARLAAPSRVGVPGEYEISPAGRTILPPWGSSWISRAAPFSHASSSSTRKRHRREPGSRPTRVSSCTVRSEHRRRSAISSPLVGARPLPVTVRVTAVTPSRAQREPAPVDGIATCPAPSSGTVNEDHRGERRASPHSLARGLASRNPGVALPAFRDTSRARCQRTLASRSHHHGSRRATATARVASCCGSRGRRVRPSGACPSRGSELPGSCSREGFSDGSATVRNPPRLRAWGLRRDGVMA